MKKCGRCGEYKSYAFFSKNKEGKNGLYSICKLCRAEIVKEYNQRPDVKMRTKIRRREYMRGYRKTQKNQEYQNRFSHSPEAKKQKSFRMQRLYITTLSKDPFYRLNKSMSRGIRYALKFRKANLHWEQCVGYSLVELIRHIENNFTNGMTWSNYGKWHIDHKIPKSSFNLNEFKKCWSLNNLQPLWAKDNLKKGVKV